MKKAFCILLLPFLIACMNNTKPIKCDITSIKSNINKSIKHIIITPYELIDGYTVIDTGFLDAVENVGKYAVIQKNGKLIDTIDKGFGMQKIHNNLFLYLTITDTAPLDKNTLQKTGYMNGISGSFGRYILIAKEKKQHIAKLATDFNDGFSSPQVINGKVYFWQIKKQKSSELNKILAAEYDPINNKTKNYYLFNDDISSDDRGYFPIPYLKNDTIYFNMRNNRITKFSKTFKAYN